jgi:glycosyltransferase involved in cell wall biosynthesis
MREEPRTMLIVTNTRSFPQRWTASSGEEGQSAVAQSLWQLLSYGRRRDAVFVINCDPALVLRLAALFTLVPFLRRPLISVDLVLRRPRGKLQTAVARIKKFLFSRVDHHIHYFKDLSDYREIYGIGPERSSFVPFKPNIRHRQNLRPQPDGEYVLCLGRSMRDYDTFFEAVEQLPYAAAIPDPDLAKLRANGARFSRDLDRLPKNVRRLADDGSEEAQVRILNGARLVVLPIVKVSLLAGISIALNAMLLGKCVIGSEGPGISDVFSEELLTVPPEDPGALAGVIKSAWTDDGLRLKTAAAGYRYALSLGGEAELYQRIIDQVVGWSRQGPR